MAPHRPWQPRALRRSVLLSFAFLFAIITISLGAVYKYSNDHNGISTPQTRLRYLWTYGPSSLFIIISGLWATVCYNTKTLAPWRVLLQGQAGPKTLSLDYTSKNQFNALYSSLKQAHWDVFLAITGALCLDILIILSTGLFRLKEFTIIDSNFNFPLTTSLNRTGTIRQDNDALSVAYAISNYGLDYPDGTQKDFAYATIDPDVMSPNATANVFVDAVYPDVSCNVTDASWTYGMVSAGTSHSNFTSWLPLLNNTPHFTRPGALMKTPDTNCQTDYLTTFYSNKLLDLYAVGSSLVNCSQDSPKDPSTKFMVLANSMTINNWNTTKPTANMTWQKVDNGDLNDTYFFPMPDRMVSSNSACILCTIRPQLRNASVSVNHGSWYSSLMNSPRGKSRLKRQISGRDTNEFEILGQDNNWNLSLESQLQQAVIKLLLEDSFYLTGPPASQPTSTSSNSSLDNWVQWGLPFFKIMNNTNPRASVKDMIDPGYLANSTETALQLLTTQILSRSLFPQANGNRVGEQILTEDRLIVSTPAFGLMIAFLAVMIAVSLMLAVSVKATMLKDPGSIASKATILARSPDVINLIRRQENFEESHDQRDLLYAGYFKAGTTYEAARSKFSISAQKKIKGVAKYEALSSPLVKQNWWHPWSSSILWKLLTIVVPLVGIGSLEGLLVKSDRDQGIANVSFNSYTQYAWLYVPVLVIFSINALFTAVSATNRIVEPYVALRKGPSPAARSLSVDLVNRVTISAMWLAVNLGYIGTAASILATLFGAILPIAASGLYRVQNLQHFQAVTLNQANGFNPSFSLGSSNGTQVNPMSGFILYQNMTYPRWTYDKYALPEVDLNSSMVSNLAIDKFGKSWLSMELPAVYGVANCSPIANDTIAITGTTENGKNSSSNSSNGFSISFDSSLPRDCPPLNLPTSVAVEDNFLLARMFTLSGSPSKNATAPGTLVANASLSTYHGGYTVPKHCPLAVAVLIQGVWEGDRPKNKTNSIRVANSIAMQCSPYVNQETLDITFSVPDFAIPSSKPPVPKPNTQTYFSEAEVFNQNSVITLLPDHKNMNSIDPLVPGLDADPFFQAVFGGVNGTLPSVILNQDGHTTQRLQDGIDSVYGTLVAQVYNQRRVPTNSTTITTTTTKRSTPPQFSGLIQTPALARVRQDTASTRIIQSILVVMVVCALISTFFVNGRKLLPNNPCSIATVAQLLSYSTILSEDTIPLGSEFLNDKELRRKGVLEDGLYSLGWWDSAGKQWYGIDMGKAEKKDDAGIVEEAPLKAYKERGIRERKRSKKDKRGLDTGFEEIPLRSFESFGGMMERASVRH